MIQTLKVKMLGSLFATYHLGEVTQLGEYIGSLTERRTHQILAGMQFLQLSFLPDNTKV